MIVVFGLLVVSAARMSSTGAVARGQAAVTAGGNALAEGSSLLALANESRFDVAPCPAAGAQSTGTAVFNGTVNGASVNDTVTYKLPTCVEQFAGTGSGRRCALCLLNPSGLSNASLSTNRFLGVAGEIDIAGAANTSGSGQVCASAVSPPPATFAACDGGGIIRYFNASAPPDAGTFTNWSPRPQLTTGGLADPLSALPAPSTSGSKGAILLKDGDVWAPGVYDSVTTKVGANVTMSGGRYVVLGAMAIGNLSKVQTTGAATAMVYFGPLATLAFGNKGVLTVNAPGSSDATYNGIAVYFDRSNHSITDNQGTSSTLSASGTIYGAAATFNFGDAEPGIIASRIVAWSVAFSGNPHGIGLNVDAGGFPILCSQYTVAGSSAGAVSDPDLPPNTRAVSPYGASHAQFQDCRGGASTTSTISQFNYIP
ncbi:MAG TPA: hypothetical protein VN193_14035 [Candidatus Angelobacter sp.]|nr:hypothetical protein [Candidatus Angelobacter sp.]